MNDDGQSKEQLLNQIADLRQRVAELEKSVAAHQQAEEALRESEERLRQLTSATREVFWLRDAKTLEMLYVSPAYEEVWGRSCESLYQKPTSFLDAVHPDDIDRIMEAIRKQYDGVPFDQEYRIFRPGGSLRWVWGRTFLIRNDAGEIYRAAALAEDITARKLAEAALRASEERLRQLTSSIREVFWLRDAKTLEILYVSPAYEEVWGRSCESLYQTPTSFLEAVHPDDINRLMEAIRVQYEIPFDQEYRISHSDGSLRWIWGRTFLIHDEAGEIYRTATLAEDITARKLAEAALRQSNAELQAHNEELDAYAHTVAHDLKNPLGNLLGFAETLNEYYASMPDEERLNALRVVVRNGLKMNSIIDELLMLSEVRKTEVVASPLDMGHIVVEVLRRLSLQIANTHAEIERPDEWPLARGYAPWIEEVWLNYLSNALKYGGQPPHIQLGTTTQADGQVCFWVRDNGRGIAPQDQARLFTAFTRLDQIRAKGHGLGLSIVRRIMEKLGGQVKVESDGATGHGSTFGFILPGVIAQDTGEDQSIP